MPGKPVTIATYAASEPWGIPIRTPVDIQEPGDPSAMPDRHAHEDMFTFIKATLSDLPTIEAMFKRCSVRALHYRFFRPLPSAPLGYLEEVLADGENHHAFVVRRNGNAIGLAELHVEGPWSGALALIIEDPYQRIGIGTEALQLLVRRARELGLRMLIADVLFENAPVLRALRRIGPTSVSRIDDIFHVEVDLKTAELTEDSRAECPLRAG
jgi:RimJ/RimL family protein N-acetyltransferase